jgi:DNA-binding HxlR family transcriptional regulator
MEGAEHRRDPCSVAETIEIVGERWSLLVLREAFFGVRRFDQFQRNLGIARNILSTRLQTLVRAGILERRRYQEEPERFEYRLTQAGRDLYPAVIAIMKWGDEYLAEEAGPPVVLRHSCGELIDPVLVCDHCGGALHPHDVTPEPGPGAQVPTAAA